MAPQHITATPGAAAPGRSQALAGADPPSQPSWAERIPGNPWLQNVINKQGTLPGPAAAPSLSSVTSAAQLCVKYSMAHYPGEESPSPVLLRPGGTGSCCLVFAQAALISPIRNSLGAPSYPEPGAKPSCAREGFPADQILAFGTASMKNLSLLQGSVSIFLSSTCLPFHQKMRMVLLWEKAKLGTEQRGPLMLRKAGMLRVENPWGFFLVMAEGFSIHCLHVLGIHPECSGSGKMQGSGKALESLKPTHAAVPCP